jgi:hypothetical protein
VTPGLAWRVHALAFASSGVSPATAELGLDIKLNVLDSLSRKELLRLVTVGSSREAVNLAKAGHLSATVYDLVIIGYRNAP